VTTAAKSISINPQKCSNTNRSFLTLSLRIRYFEIVRGGGATHAAFLPRLTSLIEVNKKVTHTSEERDASRKAWQVKTEKFAEHIAEGDCVPNLA